MTQKWKSSTTVLAALAAASLIGCGGGGGGDTASAPTSYPVSSAFDRLLTTQANFSATSSDGTLAISQTFTPSAQGQFSPTSPVSKTVSISTVVRQNGAVISTDQSVIYFNSAPQTFVAAFGKAVQQSPTLPASASIGSSGRAYFTAGVGRGLFSTPPQEGTWSLESGSNGRAWLCLTNQLGYGLLSSPSFEVTYLNTYCFSIDANGTASGYKATLATDRRSTINNPVVDTSRFGS